MEELAAGGIVVVEGVDDDVGADHAEVGTVAELVVELGGGGDILLGREGLVAVGALVVGIEPEMGLAVQEGAGIDVAQDLVGVPGAVGSFEAHMGLVAQLGREEVNGAAEVGGGDIGGGAGAAVEVHMADGRGGNVSPGVVAGIVRVVEGHAVPGHGVVVVDEAAEVDLGLAVADTVGGVADGAGGSLDDVRKVGYRRGVLSYIVAGDFRAG